MKRSLNLMSEYARKREQMRRVWRLWSRILAGVLVMLVLGGVAQWQMSRAAATRQAAAESAYEPIRQLKNENRIIREQLKNLETSERIPLALAKDQPLLGLVGFVAQEIAKHDGKIYLQQLEIEHDPIEPATARQPSLGLSLNGTANDTRAVSQLVDSLRNTGPFNKLELGNNQISRTDKQTRQVFSIQGTN